MERFDGRHLAARLGFFQAIDQHDKATDDAQNSGMGRPMRPGSFSQKYKDPVAKTGAYCQLS